MNKLEIAQYLADQVTRQFSDYVDIVAVYGSVALGKETQFSDIDMFAIVTNKSETDLPWKFVLPKYTISFWKMGWEDAERLALGKTQSAPWSVVASLIVNSKILYNRSESINTPHFL